MGKKNQKSKKYTMQNFKIEFIAIFSRQKYTTHGRGAQYDCTTTPRRTHTQ